MISRLYGKGRGCLSFPRPWNKHCPVPMCAHPRKRSPGREWVQLLAVKFDYVPRGW